MTICVANLLSGDLGHGHRICLSQSNQTEVTKLNEIPQSFSLVVRCPGLSHVHVRERTRIPQVVRLKCISESVGHHTAGVAR